MVFVKHFQNTKQGFKDTKKQNTTKRLINFYYLCKLF